MELGNITQQILSNKYGYGHVRSYTRYVWNTSTYSYNSVSKRIDSRESYKHKHDVTINRINASILGIHLFHSVCRNIMTGAPMYVRSYRTIDNYGGSPHNTRCISPSYNLTNNYRKISGDSGIREYYK